MLQLSLSRFLSTYSCMQTALGPLVWRAPDPNRWKTKRGPALVARDFDVCDILKTYPLSRTSFLFEFVAGEDFDRFRERIKCRCLRSTGTCCEKSCGPDR